MIKDNKYHLITILQEEMPLFLDLFDYDPGYFDLTKVWADGKSYVFVSTFDRANIEYTKGNFEAMVGRQRVNWGINTVWTPNDIFNSFSYFDFDYEERPDTFQYIQSQRQIDICWAYG